MYVREHLNIRSFIGTSDDPPPLHYPSNKVYRLRCHDHSHPPYSIPLPPSPNHPLNVSHLSRYQDERKTERFHHSPPQPPHKDSISPSQTSKSPITPSLCSSPSALPLLPFPLFFALRPITSHFTPLKRPSTFSPFSFLPPNTKLHSPNPHLRSLPTPPLFFLSSFVTPLPDSSNPFLAPSPEKPFHPLAAYIPRRSTRSEPIPLKAHISLPHSLPW